MNKALLEAEKSVRAREQYGIESPPEVLKGVTELARGQAAELAELRELMALAGKLRDAQRAYFQQRTDGWLREAKRLEKQFDDVFRAYQQKKNAPHLLPFGEPA